MDALAFGTLRADAATGCLWLEGPDGEPTGELLLQGDSYRVDFAASPAAVLDGDELVARVGDKVEVGGGSTDEFSGVEGCPVHGGIFLGHFPET